MRDATTLKPRQPQARGVSYWNPELVNEREAASLWGRVLAAIDRAEEHGHVATNIAVGGLPAEISALTHGKGRVRAFWVRTLADNQLVLKGSRAGLLPIELKASHDR